jgi:recombination protein RecR
MIPEPIQRFIERFSRLPSLGPRLATRLAFFLAGLDKTALAELETSLSRLSTLGRCTRCFFLTSDNATLCPICRNPARDPGIIAIVEKETDLLAFENTGRFTGVYFLLGELPERGILEPEQKRRLELLKHRIETELAGTAEEIIVAVNLNTFGDFANDIIRQEFKTWARKITRLGRGIPTGGEIEFADEETLGSALERRN